MRLQEQTRFFIDGLSYFISRYGCLLSIVFLLSPHVCAAQTPNYVIRHLEWRHGLTDRTVMGFAFDKHGLGWLGNRDGVHIYDGLRIYPASAFAPTQTGLLDREVRALSYDSVRNRILVLALVDDTVSVLYAISYTPIIGIQTKKLKSWPGIALPSFGYAGNKFSFVLSGKLHILVPGAHSVLAETVFSINTALLLPAADGGTCIVDFQGNTYRLIDGPKGSVRLQKVHQIDSTLLYGLFTDKHRLSDKQLEQICRNPFKKLHQIPLDALHQERNAALGVVCAPDQSNYLYGSMGLQQVYVKPPFIRSFQYQADLRTICFRDTANGYIACSRGVFPFNKHRGIQDSMLLGLNYYYCAGTPIGNNKFIFLPLYEHGPGILIDLISGAAKAIRVKRGSLHILSAYSVKGKRSLLLGTDKGLWQAAIFGDTLVQLVKQIPGMNGPIQAITEITDTTGNRRILAGGKFGLYDVGAQPSQTRRLLSQEVLCISELPDRILIGTRKKGMYTFSKRLKLVDAYRSPDALISNTVYSIAYDRLHHCAWIGCSEGLTLLQFPSLIRAHFRTEDGLAGNEQNRTSVHIDKQGETIALGGVAGLSLLSAQKLFDELKSIPQQQIWAYETFFKNGTSELHWYHSDRPIVCDAAVTKISLKYQHFGQGNPLANLLYQPDDAAARFVPYDEDIHISGLAPGKHTIKTFRLDTSGRLQPLQNLHIHIRPPWHQSTLAKAALFATLLLSIMAIFLQREKLIKQRLMRKAQKDKTRLFSIIAHDLRSPMKAYNGLADVLKFQLEKQNWDSVRIVSQHIDDVGRRMDLLLDNLLNWSLGELEELQLQKQTLSISACIQEILPVYQTIAKQKSIELNVQLSGKDSIVTDRNILDLILRNLLDNALKNAPVDSIVFLQISSDAAGICIEVRNTITVEAIAILREVEKYLKKPGQVAARGLGIQFISRVLQILKGTVSLQIQSENPPHVKWTIHIPY